MKEKSTSCTLWFMAILVDIKLSLKIVLFKEKDTSESKKKSYYNVHSSNFSIPLRLSIMMIIEVCDPDSIIVILHSVPRFICTKY